MRSITIFLLIALANTVVNVNAATCPRVRLGVTEDACNNINQFSKAFEDVYKAAYNYIDWYNFYGVPPNTKTLLQMSQTSFAQVTEVQEVDERNARVHSMRGGYAMQLGNDRTIGARRKRFLDVMEGRNLEDIDCSDYPPLLCKSMGWCCWFCACKTRRNLVHIDADAHDDTHKGLSKAILNEAYKMEAAAVAELEIKERELQKKDKDNANTLGDVFDVCAWLLFQDWPDCLEPATVICEHLGEFA